MDSIWAEVSCEVPNELVDQLAEFLFSLTGNGVCIENLSLDAFSLDGLADTPVKTVKCYLAADGVLEEKVAVISAYLAGHAGMVPGFVPRPPSVTRLQEEEWADSWKKYFRPSRVGRRVVIKPTWEEWEPAQGDIIIEIDPGMAFGTGTHATSRLCLETLERIYLHESPFESPAVPDPADLLDVGAGSGILAIAAAKLGAGRVVAIDIDPGAVSVANENAVLNRVEGTVTVSGTPLAEVSGHFAVVVANILAEDLVRMGRELVGRLRQGGVLVLSGILSEKEETVLAGFAPFRLNLVETTRLAEWSCLAYRLGRS